MKRSRLGLLGAMLLAATLVAPSGWAQSTSDKAAAEGLFDQGRAAMQRGDFAQACGLLERSQHTDPAVGTLLYLAECYEKSGRTASAWATFREAADAADAAHEAPRAKVGRERAARLEPHLARLTIQMASETEQLTGLTVDRSGQAVPAATWNVPVPVDPGDQTITVSAPGYDPWTTTITVPAKAASISVTVPPLRKNPEAEKAAAAAAAQATAAPAAAAPSPDETRTDLSATAPPATTERPGSTQRTVAYVLGGAGVVGIVVGSIFGVTAISKNTKAENRCKQTNCDNAEGVAFAEDAKSAATVSSIAFGVGLAALAGGAVLYFTAPRESPTATTLRARASIGQIVLEGSF